MNSASALCIRCFDYGNHSRQECLRKSVICCSMCFRLNYLTKHCCQSSKDVPDDEYPQAFRMVGTVNTVFFTDVQVGKKFVAAKLNTNLSMSKMDIAVLEELSKQPNYERNMNSATQLLPVCVDQMMIHLKCDCQDLGKTLRLELGMDFLLKNSIQLQLDHVVLFPSRNGKQSKCKDARFLIKITIGQKTYEAVIDIGITRSIINFATVSEIHDSSPENISFDLLGDTADVTFKRHNIETVVNFQIQANEQQTIRLGTDFLKKRHFVMRFNGINLNIQNPWKSNNPDAIDFVYNHPLGNKLKYVIKNRFEENIRRCILPKPIPKAVTKAKQD